MKKRSISLTGKSLQICEYLCAAHSLTPTELINKTLAAQAKKYPDLLAKLPVDNASPHRFVNKTLKAAGI